MTSSYAGWFGLAVLAWSSIGQAADYYVDNTAAAASDAGPGSESEPWAQCPGMPGWTGSTELQPGDVVYFQSAGVWTASGAEVVLDVTPGVTYDGAIWGTGVRAILRAESDLNRSVVNFMTDHPTEPSIVRGFEIDAGGYTTTGVGINWPWSQGSLDGATKRVENCVVHGVWSDSSAGNYEYGIVVSSGGGGGGRGTANVEILDSEVFDISRGGINLYASNDDTTGWIRTALVRGNVIHGTGTDPNYAGSALAVKNHIIDAVVEYNVVRDSVAGSGLSVGAHATGGFHSAENLLARHNVISGHPHAGIVVYFEAAGQGVSADFVGNLVTDNTYAGFYLMWANGPSRLRLYNNTFARNAEAGWAGEIFVNDNEMTFSEFEVVNNIAWAAAGATPLDDAGGQFTRHEHNLYFSEDGSTLVSDPSGDYDAAALATWEPTALSADPGLPDSSATPSTFVGTYGVDLRPDTDGFSVGVDSPAVDAGTDLGAPWNTSINSVSRPADDGWDIGAYEYGTPSSQAGAGGAAAGGTSGGSTGGSSGSASGGTGGAAAGGVGGAATGGVGGPATSGAGGAPAPAAADAAEDDGGCGCRVGSDSRERGSWVVMLALVGLLRRRR